MEASLLKIYTSSSSQTTIVLKAWFSTVASGSILALGFDGLRSLPSPHRADVFFDLEGFPFATLPAADGDAVPDLIHLCGYRGPSMRPYGSKPVFPNWSVVVRVDGSP